MADLINAARAIPNLDKRAEVHTVDISTDSNGDGSATQSWDTAFGGGVFVLVSGDEGADWFVSSSGTSQATVNVEGATANSTVTATVLAVGDD